MDVSESHPFIPFDPDLNKVPIKPLEIHQIPDIKNFEFSHEYILEHLETYLLNPTLCTNCCPATKYFQSPEPYIQQLYDDTVKWKLRDGAILSVDVPPYTGLKDPVYAPGNIKVRHPPSRPRGHIILKRQMTELSGVKEFCHTARLSSLAALKTLQHKPETARELTFKLHEDVNNGVLVSLEDFLKLPEVRESGINESN